MQSKRAIAAFYNSVRGHVRSVRIPDPVRDMDVAVLYDASDRLAAMWVALTLAGDEHHMIPDVEYVMRMVRSATQHCEAVQSALRRIPLIPSVPSGPARLA